jgi:hypothetical protein
MFRPVMYVFIALVVVQSASTKPTIVIVRLADEFPFSRWRLPPRRSVVCAGTIEPKLSIRFVIVSGLAKRVKTPTATSSDDGIARKEA